MILAVTGHRPDRLGGYGPILRERVLDALTIRTLAAMRPDHVRIGMALGFDQSCARACVLLGIPFTAVPPKLLGGGHGANWPPAARAEYKRLLAAAAVVEDLPFAGAMQEMRARNGALLVGAEWLLSLWDGTPSGTGDTVRLAVRAGLPMWNLWTEWTR